MREWPEEEEPSWSKRPPLRQRWSYRGDTLPVDVQVEAVPPFSPPGTPAVPTNVTGWVFWFTAKFHFSDPDQQAVVQITNTTSVPAGGVLNFVNPQIGQIEFLVPPLATRGLPDGRVRIRYDVQAKDTAGRIFTVQEGVWDVFPDVTSAIA